ALFANTVEYPRPAERSLRLQGWRARVQGREAGSTLAKRTEDGEISCRDRCECEDVGCGVSQRQRADRAADIRQRDNGPRCSGTPFEQARRWEKGSGGARVDGRVRTGLGAGSGSCGVRGDGGEPASHCKLRESDHAAIEDGSARLRDASRIRRADDIQTMAGALEDTAAGSGISRRVHALMTTIRDEKNRMHAANQVDGTTIV